MFRNFGKIIAINKAIPAATKNKPRQDKTNSKLLKSNVVAAELIRELVAINPQILPCLSFENVTRIIFAIDGQPADFENMVKKYNAKKAVLLDRVPKIKVVIAAKPIAKMKTRLPPNLSANTPLVNLPTKFPAVPHPTIAP